MNPGSGFSGFGKKFRGFSLKKMPNIEHQKVQFSGFARRRNEVNPGSGFSGFGKKFRGFRLKKYEIQII